MSCSSRHQGALAAGRFGKLAVGSLLSERHPLPPPPHGALAGASLNFSPVFPYTGLLMFLQQGVCDGL